MFMPVSSRRPSLEEIATIQLRQNALVEAEGEQNRSGRAKREGMQQALGASEREEALERLA